MENLPGSDETVLNAANDYRIDRVGQREPGRSYTGIHGTGAQDTAMQDSQGAIYDRTNERLGTADAAIIRIRRYFLDALRGVEPLLGLDPATQGVRSATYIGAETFVAP